MTTTVDLEDDGAQPDRSTGNSLMARFYRIRESHEIRLATILLGHKIKKTDFLTPFRPM
jgi:hypothetical protein